MITKTVLATAPAAGHFATLCQVSGVWTAIAMTVCGVAGDWIRNWRATRGPGAALEERKERIHVQNVV